MSGYTAPDVPAQNDSLPARKQQADRSLCWLLAIINLPWLILPAVWLLTRHA